MGALDALGGIGIAHRHGITRYASYWLRSKGPTVVWWWQCGADCPFPERRIEGRGIASVRS